MSLYTTHPPLVLEFALTPPVTADFTAAYVGPPGPTTWGGITDKPAVIATGADAAEARTTIGAVADTDPRLSDARPPTGAAGGVLSGSYPNPGFAVDMATKAELDLVSTAKVDKVAGKGLSTEDYSTAEKSKLAGVATGATANATDAQLRDRATHTGAQAIGTVTGLQGALDAKAPLASPALTGVPSAPTAAVGTNTTQLATTAFSKAQIAADAAPAAHVGSGGAAHANAVASGAAGFMTGADKTKLDGVAAGAQVNTVTSVAAKTGAVTLVKGDVGLGDVDNTTDANKPISTATQTALNEKANLNVGNNFVGANSFDGILTLKNTTLASQDITFDGSTAAGMRVSNANGYVSLAPLNSGGAHIYTNLPKFFFNAKPVSIGNAYASYSGDLQLHRGDVNKVTIGATATTFVDPVAAPTFNYSYLSANTLSNLDTVVGGFGVAYSSGAVGKPAGTDHAVISMFHSATWGVQMAGDWRTNLWYVRNKNNGAWGAWATLWTSASLTNLNQLTNGPGYITAAGNAATATKLATARAINGVNFDGTANITVVDATKEPAIAAGTTAQYRRGDKTWQPVADLPVSTAQAAAIATATAIHPFLLIGA